MTCRSHGLRRPGALRFAAAAVLAKDEVIAVCCALAEAERLLETAAPSVGEAVAAARELLEATAGRLRFSRRRPAPGRTSGPAS